MIAYTVNAMTPPASTPLTAHIAGPELCVPRPDLTAAGTN